MAGTMTEVRSFDGSQPRAVNMVNQIRLTWTADAAGAVTADTEAVNGTILRVVFNPLADAPTDNYDVTLTDEDGVDVLAGLGADRDTANTECVFPVDTTSGLPFSVAGVLSLTIAAAGDSNDGEIILYVR